ncbi:decaprenyl-phosphate phosphoribosyltransferase [Longimycelium tulufanense]|uniref:Decaprenyl-phosphate phosphoribosyltransferase n=1 Tax=Longimycelium tulufanense TaxID=907463 RepID=A0A8J3CFT4_9PSEU|nr:decaprenyl-phosphate phosphoribosyltransferase [Longimycelium tulufanense]GGM68957.1 decaprenyl-phosphate phosphoribosyltransferase [Longimycelium tulufanense]
MTVTASEVPGPVHSRSDTAVGLLLALRPRQWTKNVLVLAAPFAAGALTSAPVLLRSLGAFAAFALAASGVYLVNDIRDRKADRQHPTKCRRPIAAGRVPIWLAATAAGALLAGALALSGWVALPLLVVLGVYEGVQLGYCFGLKHVPVVEMGIVASGFLLRAIAGGAATGIVLSNWFLLVSAFGSLFVVAGKRYAEALLVAGTDLRTRQAIRAYTPSYLRFVWMSSAAVIMSMYGLWAFDIHGASDSRWPIISMVPFVLAVLRYGMEVDNGSAGAPEDALLGDRVLQVLFVLWAASLGLALYVL